MDEEEAKSLVIKLTNAAYEAGMWKHDPDHTMVMRWREKAEEIGDEIVRHLTSKSSGLDDLCDCDGWPLGADYCNYCGGHKGR